MGELMTLDIPWGDLEPFLVSDGKQSDRSIAGHKSRYKVLTAWFANKEFDRKNFSVFLYECKKAGKSTSYLNNCIKLVKHIGRYLGIKDEFGDYSYFDEGGGQPEFTLTPDQITKLAEARIKYLRFKNRKEKHRALILFLGNVGSRIDETLHIEWRDIISSGVPMIHFRSEITKTKKERFCPIPKWLHATIMALPRDNQFIFSKIDAANFRNDLKLRCQVVGIKENVTPHTFRDSSINNKLEFGMPLEKVTAYHGHSTTNTTYKYYVQIQAKQLAQSLYQFDPAFRDDQTYDSVIEANTAHATKTVNPRVCVYTQQSYLNDENKRVLRLEFIEK